MNFRPADPGRRLWDTWFYDHDGEYHLFYLSNPVGDDGASLPWDAFSLAVSRDLIHWQERGEVFTKSDRPEDWDSQIITTGDIIRYQGRYYMSYRATTERTEKNGIIVSDDLLRWKRISPDPVLVTSPPYEYRPQDTVNNYVEMRDVTMNETEDGSVEGIFTARMDSGTHAGRGVLATAHTRDMLHWKLGEPIFAPGVFNVIEVPSRYHHGDNHYLLYCVNHGTEPDLGTPLYPHMWQYTGYGVSKDKAGPFEYVPDQVLGVGDAYVGRIVNAGDEILFVHHLVSSRPAFCFPKKVLFQKDGTIRLGYWQGVDSLGVGPLQSGFAGIEHGTGNGLPVCAVAVSGDRCTLDNGSGFGDAYVMGDHSDFVLDIGLDFAQCRSAGLLVHADPDGREGVMLHLSAEHPHFQVGRSKRTYGHVAPGTMKYVYEGSELATGSVTVRVVSRSEGIDWYVNSHHVLTTIDERYQSGRIGLFVRQGRAHFTGLRIQPLQPEGSA